MKSPDLGVLPDANPSGSSINSKVSGSKKRLAAAFADSSKVQFFLFYHLYSIFCLK